MSGDKGPEVYREIRPEVCREIRPEVCWEIMDLKCVGRQWT